MGNYWLNRILNVNPDGTEGPMEWEVNNYCMRCQRGIRSWFHGQGCICSECSGKGYNRDNCAPSILEVFGIEEE